MYIYCNKNDTRASIKVFSMYDQLRVHCHIAPSARGHIFETMNE